MSELVVRDPSCRHWYTFDGPPPGVCEMRGPLA